MALSRPAATAIVTDSRRISYIGLLRMADRIAAALTESGGAASGFVGVTMSHTPQMIAALLGINKTCAAFVPAEPSLPAVRIKYMMESADTGTVITDRLCESMLDGSYPGIRDCSRPQAPAYVLFTSGTTGKPKGVVIANSSVVNYAEAFHREFRNGAGDVMLQQSVCSFDIFIEEVFATLLNGAALAIPPEDVRTGEVSGLMKFVERHGVTQISGFPYLLADMNRLPSIPLSLDLLISGGDVLRASYIDRLKDTGVRIYNTYGPSETTVCATYFRCDNARPLPDGTFPIGKPVKGALVRIVDDKLREVPEGQTGEICISGEGVGLGYLGNPPEQANYITMPDGARMYMSGDLGYRLPSGDIAFLHRRDRQVMILGRRVEPEEVQNVLNACPQVERGVVKAYADDAGLAYLVAYWVPGPGGSLEQVKSWLRSRLADFMVPEFLCSSGRFRSLPEARLTAGRCPE